MRYDYISADNHLDIRWLPKDMWQQRVAAKFKDRAPKVEETPEGSFWFWEGKRRVGAAAGSSNAKMLERQFGGIDLPPGALPPSDPALMLKHLDIANIYAGVYYGDTRKYSVEDPELRKEVFRVYNNFALELNATSPDRLLVLPNLPSWLPEECLPEFQRLVKAGARAVEFGVYDVAKPIFDEVWEPLWAAAAEAGVPICCHIGDKAGMPYPPNKRGASMAHFSTTPFALARPVAEFVFCGAFEKNPKLQVSFAECRIGWVPFLVEWMDRQVHERPADPTAPLSLLPSEYIRRNCTFTFEEDYIGARLLQFDWSHIQASVMWGADYPHEQGTWPSPRKIVDKLFEGVDPKVKQDVVFDHAARIFHIAGGRA